MITIDINCDLGEGGLYDHKLMPLITSCSIACGGHFGNMTAKFRFGLGGWGGPGGGEWQNWPSPPSGEEGGTISKIGPKHMKMTALSPPVRI